MTDEEMLAMMEEMGLTGGDMSRIFDIGAREGQRWKSGRTAMPQAVKLSLRILGAVRGRTDAVELAALLRAEADELERVEAARKAGRSVGA